MGKKFDPSLYEDYLSTVSAPILENGKVGTFENYMVYYHNDDEHDEFLPYLLLSEEFPFSIKIKEIMNKQRDMYSYDLMIKTKDQPENLKKIKIAILDTGVDFFHADLNQSIRGGKSFIPSENWFQDEKGHGTHCAGIIAGIESGLAHGVQLYIGKVLDRDGRGSKDSLAEGIEWAIDQEVDIISMSLGQRQFNLEIWEKVQTALKNGIIVVCAAGNDGSWYEQSIRFPASIGGVIRVGSVDIKGNPSYFSSVGGVQIDVCALGSDVLSTWPSPDGVSKYCKSSGTSMATPFISSICANLLAYDMSLNSSNLRLNNCHCMKDMLGKLSFNNTQDVAKGRGTVALKECFEVPSLFQYRLKNIC